MADINVERKDSGGRSFLPWILGLLLLALLIWGLSRLLGGNDNDEVNNATTTDTTVTSTETMPVTDPAATGTMAPAGAAGATMPMDSMGATGTNPQLTGAVDSAGGDTVAEGPTGNP